MTVDQEPIAKGFLNFTPQHLGEGPVTGAEIVDGRYVARAVPLGKVRVRFLAPKQTGRMITLPDGNTKVPEIVDIIPENYRAGIEIDVTGDNDQQNFDLVSESNPRQEATR